jgi:hypothetical protein
MTLISERMCNSAITAAYRETGHGDEVASARLSVVPEKKIARQNASTTDIT